MPEIYIGTDIVSVSKISQSLNSSSKDRFIQRIFTTKEIEYCQNKPNPHMHFAGRFAAKEAVTKAFLSSEKISAIPMKSIEIISGKNRAPQVNLDMIFKFKYSCKVSISHTDEFATAYAILEISP